MKRRRLENLSENQEIHTVPYPPTVQVFGPPIIRHGSNGLQIESLSSRILTS